MGKPISIDELQKTIGWGILLFFLCLGGIFLSVINGLWFGFILFALFGLVMLPILLAVGRIRIEFMLTREILKEVLKNGNQESNPKSAEELGEKTIRIH